MRLITRADMDGIVSAVMIMDKEPVDEIIFSHPKDVQDGKVEVFEGDAIANLPYWPKASLWFDHHDEAAKRGEMPEGVKGKVGEAPSAAGLVYSYYNTPDFDKYTELVKETDKMDSANLDYSDVLNPKGWMLLGFTLDPRTGLGGFKEYSMQVIEAIRSGESVENILEMPGVNGRITRYLFEEEKFKKDMINCTEMDGNVSITDFRPLDHIPTGNRFLVYAFFARCNINVRIYNHRDPNLVMCAVGKSIFDRDHPVHVGELMAEFGGGGLAGAGTCPLEKAKADDAIKKIVDRLKM